MAKAEHLEVLRKGAGVWNRWREENPAGPAPDLGGAPLRETSLAGANLAGADLGNADLAGAVLRGARFEGADLHAADLSRADLMSAKLARAQLEGAILDGAILVSADLSHARLAQASLRDAQLGNAQLAGADLRGANLGAAVLLLADMRGANLEEAKLRDASLVHACLEGARLRGADLAFCDLRSARLVGANLWYANLAYANLRHSDLRGAELAGASLGWTSLGDVDLSSTGGIESVRHQGPSTIGIDTVERTACALEPARRAKVETFLRGAGVSDVVLGALRTALEHPPASASCFVSYDHSDRIFARRLYDRLQGRGVRCWLDEHQLRPGDDIYEMVDRNLRVSDRVLLCASRDSLGSWWVRDEVGNTVQREEELSQARGEPVRALLVLDLDGHLRRAEGDGEHLDTLAARVVADFGGWESGGDRFDDQIERVLSAISR